MSITRVCGFFCSSGYSVGKVFSPVPIRLSKSVVSTATVNCNPALLMKSDVKLSLSFAWHAIYAAPPPAGGERTNKTGTKSAVEASARRNPCSSFSRDSTMWICQRLPPTSPRQSWTSRIGLAFVECGHRSISTTRAPRTRPRGRK
jgi:hypothetical protein